MQTAKAILQGCGYDSEVLLDHRLGDPGPFVAEPSVAGSVFLETGILDIVRHQLSSAAPLPGMRSTADGVRTLIELVADGLRCSGRLNVFVTHDSILAVLVAWVLGSLIEQVGWPDYLDGLLIWRSGEGLNITWREFRKATYPLGG